MQSATPDPDASIDETVRERPDQPIRLRVQPFIFRGRAGYRVWRDVSFRHDCPTPDDAFAFREALSSFFASLDTVGPDATRRRLTPPAGRK